MRALSIIVVWSTAFALALALYSYGLVQHYWYDNGQGRGYDIIRWQGDSLDDVYGYQKGYHFRYSTFRFEKNAEIRTIAIVAVFSCASAGTILLLRYMPKRRPTTKT